MNIFTGRCDEPMYGQCPYCRGSLTMGHKCPGQRAAEEALESMTTKPMKLATMVRIWLAMNHVEQATLAGQLGTNPSTLSRFLNGHGIPDGTTMAKLISWLLEP